MEEFKFNKQLAQEYYVEASDIEEEESLRKSISGYRNLRNSGIKKILKISKTCVVHPETEDHVVTSQEVDKRYRSKNSLTFNVLSKNSNSEERPFELERGNGENSLDFTGVDTLNNEAKRELTYRSTLSTPSSRVIQQGLLGVFIVISILLVTTSLLMGYFISHEVTDHVTTTRSACAPIMGITTIMINLRGFQLVHWFGTERFTYDLSTQMFLSLDENKKMMEGELNNHDIVFTINI